MTVTTLPRVDVVIATRNEPRLSQCLEALEKQTYPRELVTIAVVNNGDAGTLPPGLQDDPRYLLLHEPVPGAGAARNKGVASTSGQVIAITDADCVPSAQWLEAGVRALMEGEPMAAGGVEFSYEGEIPTPVEYADARFHVQQERYARRGYAATGSAFYWRHAFEAAGGFDPKFLRLQDMDLGLRISKGKPIPYVPQALVRHPAQPSLRLLLRKRLLQAHHSHRTDPWTWGRVLRRIAPRPWRTYRELLTDPTLPRISQRLAHAAIIQLLHSAGGLVGARELLRRASGESSLRRASANHVFPAGVSAHGRESDSRK